MAIKPFEQVYPGQNSAIIKPKKEGDVKDWERKQRLKEYRIAARREKRNRKSDEKKQRKLNATILRRMVCLEKHSRGLVALRLTAFFHLADKKPSEIQQKCSAK
jgi:hypothetical protein